jgi:tRNA(adenine34) deaminase
MERLKIHAIDPSELDDVLSIRRKVFTEEQGIDPNADKDGLDETADHIIAIYDGLPVGCTRIRFLNGKAKLERLAVLREFRNKRIATELIKSTIEYCNSKKVNEIYFDAQYYLKGFYERFGFKIMGKPFEEVGIEHIEMHMEF